MFSWWSGSKTLLNSRFADGATPCGCRRPFYFRLRVSNHIFLKVLFYFRSWSSAIAAFHDLIVILSHFQSCFGLSFRVSFGVYAEDWRVERHYYRVNSCLMARNQGGYLWWSLYYVFVAVICQKGQLVCYQCWSPQVHFFRVTMFTSCVTKEAFSQWCAALPLCSTFWRFDCSCAWGFLCAGTQHRSS